jgi:hypothetical protein
LVNYFIIVAELAKLCYLEAADASLVKLMHFIVIARLPKKYSAVKDQGSYFSFAGITLTFECCDDHLDCEDQADPTYQLLHLLQNLLAVLID